jgi:hypothetical protein
MCVCVFLCVCCKWRPVLCVCTGGGYLCNVCVCVCVCVCALKMDLCIMCVLKVEGGDLHNICALKVETSTIYVCAEVLDLRTVCVLKVDTCAMCVCVP